MVTSNCENVALVVIVTLLLWLQAALNSFSQFYHHWKIIEFKIFQLNLFLNVNKISCTTLTDDKKYNKVEGIESVL